MKKKVFAEGLCGKKLFIIYVIGSIFGCYYEHYASDMTRTIPDIALI